MEDDKSFYCLLSNIPSTFHASDLRNFFAVFVEAEKFDLFHFRHRPQLMTAPEDAKAKDNGCSSKSVEGLQLQVKKFCCIIRFSDLSTSNEFVKKYHRKYWMDKLGNEINSRCLISQVELTPEDYQKFATKELRPPSIMPRGNIGCSNQYFLNLIKQCRLPPSLIKKLGLEFPRGRVFKRYSKVGYDYGTSVEEVESEEEEDVITGRGHVLSTVYVPKKSDESEKNHKEFSSTNEDSEASDADDDNDRCEEWERHQALHNEYTTHGGPESESKERLYEERIELKWEKGGSGLVFYTDAQYWKEERGGFDEITADDWDVDMEGYYEEGGGDKDARDILDMRRSERFQKGLEEQSVFRKRRRSPSPNTTDDKIGRFEKHTKGIGRKLMERQGWADGEGLGPSTNQGIPIALENDGQGPRDRRGLGFYGEKLEYGTSKTKPEKLSDYSISSQKSYIVGTIFDDVCNLEKSDSLLRQTYPTYIKRYDKKS